MKKCCGWDVDKAVCDPVLVSCISENPAYGGSPPTCHKAQGRIQPGCTECTCTPPPCVRVYVNSAQCSKHPECLGNILKVHSPNAGCILNIKLQNPGCTLNFKLQKLLECMLNVECTPNFKLQKLGCTLNFKLQMKHPKC